MTSADICAAFDAKDQEIARLRAGLAAVRADLVTTRDATIATPGTPVTDQLHTSLEAVSLVLGVDVPERPEAPDEGDDEGDDEGTGEPEDPEPAPAPAPEPPAPPAPAPEPEPPAPPPSEPEPEQQSGEDEQPPII